MSSLNVDEWMHNFVAEVAPDNEPKDVPSPNETKALSDYLHARIPLREAAIAYTRETISETTNGDVWYLLYHMAEDIPDTHGRLIELIRAISTLPDETRASGKVQAWASVCMADLHGDLRDHWDGQAEHIRDNRAEARPGPFVDLTIFIARLRAEGLLRTDYFDKAVMWCALEKEESLRVLDTFLLATARYLEWAVRYVFKQSCRGDEIERWDFWKSRIAALGNEGQLSEETREAAKSALARMTEVESVATLGGMVEKEGVTVQ
ncbi:MAG: hypothetical protein Q9221_007754 [Calogaya cf. arnoldii]